MELTDLTWRKTRRSGPNGGDCVEVAALTGAAWHKTRRSGPNGGSCVEVAALDGMAWRKTRHSKDNDCVELASLDGGTAVRDSKNPGGAVLAFTPREWATFLADVKTGSFDLR